MFSWCILGDADKSLEIEQLSKSGAHLHGPHFSWTWKLIKTFPKINGMPGRDGSSANVKYLHISLVSVSESIRADKNLG